MLHIQIGPLSNHISAFQSGVSKTSRTASTYSQSISHISHESHLII